MQGDRGLYIVEANVFLSGTQKVKTTVHKKLMKKVKEARELKGDRFMARRRLTECISLLGAGPSSSMCHRFGRTRLLQCKSSVLASSGDQCMLHNRRQT